MKRASIFLMIVFDMAAIFAQNGRLKILELTDSTMLDKTTQSFDSVFSLAMEQCDTCDLSKYTYGGELSHSRRPLIGINFISIGKYTLIEAFSFKLISRTRVNDSIYLYTLDLGWEIYNIVFNTSKMKLTDLANLNYYGWKKYRYKNICIFHPPAMAISTNQIELNFKKLILMAKELNLSMDSFNRKNYVSISGFTMAEVNRFIGVLTPSNYFDPMGTYGGMSDPYNQVILSGIGKSLHLHELVHLIVNPQINANRIVAEGIASYYGGVAGFNYEEIRPGVLLYVKVHNIISFDSLFALRDNQFNIIRGDYIVGAMLIDYVKKNHGIEALRLFIRHSATNAGMIKSLEEICKQNSESIFKQIFLKN